MIDRNFFLLGILRGILFARVFKVNAFGSEKSSHAFRTQWTREKILSGNQSYVFFLIIKIQLVSK